MKRISRHALLLFLPMSVQASPFLEACWSGNLKALEKLRSSGARLDEQRSDGSNCLSLASEADRKGVLRFLRQQGASLDSPGPFGRHPLHIACLKQNPGLVQELVNFGAQLESRDAEGHTPLHVAAATGCLDCVKILISKGADRNSFNRQGTSILSSAVWTGHDAVTNELLRTGADPNACGEKLLCPLHGAAIRNNVDIAQALLKAGARAFVASKNLGRSPLMLAVYWNDGRNDKLLPLLIEKMSPSELNASDALGKSALHYAAERNNYTSLDLLLKHGAKAQLLDKDQNLPLHLAAQMGADNSLIERLVKAGNDVNARNRFGETPLMLASFGGFHERQRRVMLQTLLKLGADPTLKNKIGLLPSELSTRYGHGESAEFLKTSRF